ncbi:MAG: metal-sulfur cluster assembly factor [Chitinophagaceae bacterium]|nr:metal-sulfur cluster assembly factor [Chitinophagaceae bacterium]
MKTQTNDNMKCATALGGLREVLDPELSLNVVDLGLIYQLNFEERSKEILVIMTLSTPFCPMGDSIVNSVKNNLTAGFPGYDVQVSLTFDPPWSYQMITKEGLNFLNR